MARVLTSGLKIPGEMVASLTGPATASDFIYLGVVCFVWKLSNRSEILHRLRNHFLKQISAEFTHIQLSAQRVIIWPWTEMSLGWRKKLVRPHTSLPTSLIWAMMLPASRRVLFALAAVSLALLLLWTAPIHCAKICSEPRRVHFRQPLKDAHASLVLVPWEKTHL